MYIHMFCISASLSCPSHSIDICAVVIKKKIRNMHAVSTNQFADILHFNDKQAIKTNFIAFQAADPETCSIFIFYERVWC